MFTGIVQSVGKIEEAAGSAEGRQVKVSTGTPGFTDLELGESVAVNGVCLTVAGLVPPEKGSALFFVSPETLTRTSLGSLGPGSSVNLERALLPSTRLSGHLVQGHVDGLAQITGIQAIGSGENACHQITLDIPELLTRYCVEKGSIALDGVSLTLNQVKGNEISLMLIPHTWKMTSFASRGIGDAVNVEVDITAKYLEKLCQPYLKR